jgi:predicted Rossmann fold nucleotide-binding protein DprA/Smf involved in DNA uptake
VKIAIFGSRNIKNVNLKEFLPEEVDEIVSGGAVGVDTVAANYAKENGIKLVEFLPEYNLYGKGALMRRNKKIAEYADMGIAFWDGSSKGTIHTVKYFRELNKNVKIFLQKKNI